ncbi:MAG: hypothetical protein CBC91_04045 [Rickettsiales bacterium TMED131]|nr:MAG: hypothetical protein CBC91_04045 [Rickettsiales bacterium TMED131]|tara:strand:- start:353 stop:934 length:582 start_codon:yes stop_codon:yes gene_type:complete
MKLSRRSFLVGTFATTIYATLWSIDPSKAKITAASSKKDKEVLKKMVRTLYPHERFPDGPYNRTTEDVINKGNSSPEKAVMLQEGVDKLKTDNFSSLNFKKATKYLEKMGRTEFFEHVRGTSTVTLYNDKETWELLGYEGYSSDMGGYVNRGFNDLDWLPEPRIEEHPELAAFLSESPKRYAKIKELIANELN